MQPFQDVVHYFLLSIISISLIASVKVMCSSPSSCCFVILFCGFGFQLLYSDINCDVSFVYFLLGLCSTSWFHVWCCLQFGKIFGQASLFLDIASVPFPLSHLSNTLQVQVFWKFSSGLINFWALCSAFSILCFYFLSSILGIFFWPILQATNHLLNSVYTAVKPIYSVFNFS